MDSRAGLSIRPATAASSRSASSLSLDGMWAAEEDDEVLFVGGAGVSDDEEKAEGVSRTFLGGGGNVMTRQQLRELRERSAGRSHRPATAGSRRSSGYSLSASGGGSRYSNTSSAFSSVCRSVDSYLSGTRPVAKA